MELAQADEATGYLPVVLQDNKLHYPREYIDMELAPLNARIAHLEQQAARLANLPGLPRGWKLADDRTGYELKIAMESLTDAEWQFLAEVLNVCYPTAPGQEEGKDL